MPRFVLILSLLLFAVFCGSALAQNQLDPEPYNPATELNPDMYIGSWKDSMPVHTHGCLIERAVLTRCDGDPLKPSRKGGVLNYVKRFSHATLDPSDTTSPVTLKDEQELLFVLSGAGMLKAGKQTIKLREGIFCMVPAGMTYTMTNTGTEPLTMYLVVEPTPAGFRPNTEVFVRDEHVTPFAVSDSHWVNSFKHLIEPQDGLSDLQMVLTVYLYPNTFAQPHSHTPKCEEVWAFMEGDGHVLLGKHVRKLAPGTAYLIPPNDKVWHANFNVSEKPIKFFYFARFGDHEPRK